ncbi:MAG: nucleotide exchange factor GrpE [Clostridiales bacterium]|nr:nucleotide exchange factor GrpE [Clostridiales bacterium]
MKGKKSEVDSNDELNKVNDTAGEGSGNTGECREGEGAEANEAVKSGKEAKGAKGEKRSEADILKAEVEEKAKQCAEYLNMLQRTAAEFDNFKKRTQKEKEALYADAAADVVAAFLPAVDSLEMALKACNQETDQKSLKDGVDLVLRQFKDALKKLGVEEIKSLEEDFNPLYHNAVMHIEDEEIGQNKVVEEFQKGYIYKEKVIRHSMVKVAN